MQLWGRSHMVNLSYNPLRAAHTFAFYKQAWSHWLPEVSWASLCIPIWGAGRKEVIPTTGHTSQNVAGGSKPLNLAQQAQKEFMSLIAELK